MYMCVYYILFMYVLCCTIKVLKGKDFLLMVNFKISNILKVVQKLNLPVLFSEANVRPNVSNTLSEMFCVKGFLLNNVFLCVCSIH